jgi:hypothetical protein
MGRSRQHGMGGGTVLQKRKAGEWKGQVAFEQDTKERKVGAMHILGCGGTAFQAACLAHSDSSKDGKTE